MSRPRDTTHQTAPAQDLTGFPTNVAAATHKLYRAHKNRNGPWWFSCDGSGRFDLAPPQGTCYLGFTPAAAAREAIGPMLIELGFVPLQFLSARRVSTVQLPHDHQLADTTAENAANFGVTRELCTMTPYTVPQQWAAALAKQAAGIRYETRFSTSSNAHAAAIFGPAGAAEDWPEPSPADVISLTNVAADCGIATLPPPRTATIVPPPA